MSSRSPRCSKQACFEESFCYTDDDENAAAAADDDDDDDGGGGDNAHNSQ